MKIREYLYRNHMSQAEFSRLLGINDNYFRMITRGVARPGLELCLKIEMLSGGLITLKDLRPDKNYPELMCRSDISTKEVQGDHSIDDHEKNIPTKSFKSNFA